MSRSIPDHVVRAIHGDKSRDLLDSFNRACVQLDIASIDYEHAKQDYESALAALRNAARQESK